MSPLRIRARGILQRALPFLIGDAVLLALALYLSFELRFLEVGIPSEWQERFRVYAVLSLIVKLPVFLAFRLYRMSWAHVSFPELTRVFLAVSAGSSLLGTLYFLLERADVLVALPASVLVMDYALSLLFIGAFRSAKRIHMGLTQKRPTQGRRVLLVGAGNAGEQMLRAMLRNPDARYVPIGFVDDDPAKQGSSIHGVPVLGPRERIPELIESYQVDSLIITMPSAPPRVVRDVIELGRQAGIRNIRVLPSLSELMTGRLRLSDIREVRLEDVLGRDPVKIDLQAVEGYIRQKVVLVTGAAGSIGSELCRQIAKFGPEQIIAFDQDESRLYVLEEEIGERLPELRLVAVVGDVNNQRRIEQIFRDHALSVVFHAAAYKHVPLMEAYPEEAVKTNVLGTLAVAEAALAHGIEKFVLISTDKAVNPTSVMGATKRVAEQIVQSLNERSRREGRPTRYVAVRFGNVLGSRGSVFPLFQEQIRRGGPVTVTHPEMKRYFMLPSEAALLVLQAGAMGKGGEVFVLDMGEPVSILELAREMIRLSGYEPDKDIPIVFTGIRPGEKLCEELLTAEEGTEATKHEKIFIARMGAPPPEDELSLTLKTLYEAAERGDRARIVKLLQELVPTYRPTLRALEE